MPNFIYFSPRCQSDDLLLFEKSEGLGENGLFEGVKLLFGKVAEHVVGHDVRIVGLRSVDSQVKSPEVVPPACGDNGLDSVMPPGSKHKITLRFLFV